MIIKSFELKKLDKTKINLILLYGENEGFKHSIIQDFFTKNFDGEVQKYEEDEVFKNTELLFFEVIVVKINLHSG